MAKKITYTAMELTDGKTTYYGVYHGTLLFRNGRPSHINHNRSHYVGQFVYERGEKKLSYLDMAEAYASPAYPAFDWGRKEI